MNKLEYLLFYLDQIMFHRNIVFCKWLAYFSTLCSVFSLAKFFSKIYIVYKNYYTDIINKVY
jgi:hypothetical protein